jgi:hypothetical protein
MLDLFKKVYKYHKRKVIAFIRNINFNLELFYEKNIEVRILYFLFKLVFLIIIHV